MFESVGCLEIKMPGYHIKYNMIDDNMPYHHTEWYHNGKIKSESVYVNGMLVHANVEWNHDNEMQNYSEITSESVCSFG